MAFLSHSKIHEALIVMKIFVHTRVCASILVKFNRCSLEKLINKQLASVNKNDSTRQTVASAVQYGSEILYAHTAPEIGTWVTSLGKTKHS